ncbi:MAG: DUF2914 domain-containing protein [bacterium]
MSFFISVRNFYGRFERPISSLSLIGGFVFDALTLKRLDTLWENFWVVAHLLIVGVFIVLVNKTENSGGDEKNPERAHFWYVNILQFFFGGILSTYLVFYFRSGDLSVSWPFLLILALAFWANESLKRHYEILSFQVSLFFLSIFSFATFLLPVLLHQIGPVIFLLSGAVSLLTIFLFLRILWRVNREHFRKSKKIITVAIVVIFAGMNILYFTHVLPPIPLSLKSGDAYHSIQKDADGNYVVGFEDIGWKSFVTIYPDLHIVLGEPVYVYSAVFAPTSLNTTITHKWQYYDESAKKWLDEGFVFLPVLGGRGDGFRTYSIRNIDLAGKWRVNVETTRGELIGRIRFNIISVPQDITPTYKTI